MKFHKDKKTNELLNKLSDEGWDIVFSKHLKVIHPSGHVIGLSLSPRCPYAFKHFEGDVKRLKKKLKKVKNE